jgi:hypothetical protein
MAFGTRRLAGGGNQDKIGLDRILLWRGRWLWEVLQRRVPGVFLL